MDFTVFNTIDCQRHSRNVVIVINMSSNSFPCRFRGVRHE